MKSLKSKLSIMLIICFITIGCTNQKIEMSINEDKSMTFYLEYILNMSLEEYEKNLMDETCKTYNENYVSIKKETSWYCCNNENECEHLDSNSNIEDSSELSQFKASNYEHLLKRGYTVKNISNENRYGMSAQREILNIDNVSKEDSVQINIFEIINEGKEDYLFKVKKGLISNTYTANYIVDLTNTEASKEDIEEYGKNFNYEFKLNLPHESKSNNATKLLNNNKTLTWELEYGKINEIKFEFVLKNKTEKIIKIVISIISILVIISSIVLIILKLLKLLKKK